MFNTQLSHAQLLIQRGHIKEAEEEVRLFLSANPQHGFAHAILAQTLILQKREREAMSEIQQAIQLAPNEPHVHYIHTIILYKRKRWNEAITAIQEAIRMVPTDPDYFGVLSQIYYRKHDWKNTLKAAEQGRRSDPDHLLCTNMMAAALIKMGRKDEVQKVIGEALANDPDNAFTHANQGWAMLHEGEIELALIHFRESLRINPQENLARQGILEALRARNLLYRLMLRYFLWMSRLNRQAQWGVILGGYFLMRFVRSVANGNPAMVPIAKIITVLYMIFAVLTWIATPLSDLLLRLDSYGRLLLSRTQIEATNIGLALLAAAAGMFIFGLGTGNGAFFGGALGTLALLLPVSGTFQAPAGKKRRILGLYTVLLTILGAYALGQTLSGQDPLGNLSSIFLLGWIAFSWIANIVLSIRD